MYVEGAVPEGTDPESVWFPTDGGNGKLLFKADFLPTVSDGGSPFVSELLAAVFGLALRSDPKLVVALSSLCALVGGLALRFLVLSIGMYAPVGLV